MKSALCFVAATAMLFAHSSAHAWGNDGHRIAGYIASALLTESTRQQVRSLLGNDDLAVIATRMDDDREGFEQRHPGASRWHYENREVCSAEISCPQGQCLTRQIENHIRVLQDPRAAPDKKSEAIVVLVHLVADLHQPLHLADNRDRGGNDTWVVLPRERDARRLHEVWDTRLVRMNLQRQSPSNYSRALMLERETAMDAWQTGGVQSWAVESHKIGHAIAYGTLPHFACATGAQAKERNVPLSDEYVGSSRKVVAEQLIKAGVRIAAVLNAALDKAPR